MMRWNVIAAIARAEMRLDRRLVRYWVFLVIAAGFWILSHLGLSILFKNFSAVSATVSALNPRYIVAGIGMRYALVMTIGIVFLAYDVRARDIKERIVEVLDSLPYSNLELLTGRCLGILAGIWIPAAVIVIGISTISWFFGMPVEVLSIVSWLVLLMIPGMVFAIGLTFLLTLVTRNRAVSAVLLLIALGGLFAIMIRVPVWVSPAADVLGVLMAGFPSDILPSIGTPDVFVQRLAVLLIGFALIVIAAAVHPRKDDGSASRRGMIGAAGILIGALALGWVVQLRVGLLDDLEHWREVHTAYAAEPGPDVRSIRGTVDVDPGSRLDLDLELTYVPVAAAAGEPVLFTWNPGLEIASIQDANGGEVSFTHEDGLLEIVSPPAAGADGEVVLRMTASGSPNGDFAYLDAEIHPFEVGAWDAQIFLLGFEPSVFASRYVALMPAIAWLPTSGAMAVGETARDRLTDFFRLDLTVRVPEGWTTVVAGTRTEAEGGGQRFAPDVPVPQVALFASDFERRAIEIDGVVVEALLHRKHAGAYDAFDESAEEIGNWLRERLEDASDVGLDYRLGTLSLVEVPQSLRGFGGGWRMPSTLAPPGAVLVKESGFPTADFVTKFEDRESFEDRDGGIARAKVEQVETFFENDFIGGNPFVGGARSFFAHQTDGSGPEGLPLDYVFQGMTTRLVTDARGYFSVYIINSGMNEVIGNTIQRYMQDRSQLNVVDALVDVVASRPSVWDRLLQVSLIDLDPEEDPKETIDVLALKGDAMAQSMLDDLGRETAGRFLAALLDRTRGREFTREDVLEAGREVGVDLEPWLEVWLEQTSLPGFRLTSVDAFRLADADDGSPRYQTLVTVANEEPVGGLVTVEVLATVPDGEDERSAEGPIRIDGETAIEIGVVSSRTPKSIRIEPYLSLNRGAFATPVEGAVDEDAVHDEEPFRGARPAVWTPSDAEHVVIDDLDDGFTVRASEGGRGFRLAGRERDDVETDGGLPVHGGGRVGKTFVRLEVTAAFGRYRHTVAAARPGATGEGGMFETTVERSGPWRLEVHLPEDTSGGPAFGRLLKRWTIVIEDESGSNEVEFDASDASAGWTDLGTFEVASGSLRVVFRGADKDALVLADAVRWTPPASAPPSGTATGAQP